MEQRQLTLVDVDRFTGTETILLVDRIPEFRELLRQVLQQQGYRVLVAENGQEALQLARAYIGPIDMLLTNLRLPDMNGKLLAEQVTLHRPGLKCLFMSALSPDVLTELDLLTPDMAFLPKPFGLWQLIREMRRVLDGRPA